jgi:ABC-type multidrug transport system ATPase subunit
MKTNTMSIRLLTQFTNNERKNSRSRGRFNCSLQLQTRIVDIDLSIPEGVLMAIVGPNGAAGKSTLIKSILGSSILRVICCDLWKTLC